MPSPIPVTRLLPKDFALELGARSSPLTKHAGDSTLRVPTATHALHGGGGAAGKLWSSVIYWRELRSLEPVGSGGFGSVFRALYFGETVAVKKVKKCAKNKLASRQSFWAELNAAHLRHENLVRVIAATTCVPADEENEDNIGTLLMEFAGSASLQQVIYGQSAQEKPLRADRCVRYSTDIARGLRYLHTHGIVHLDVKPANVLVSDTTDICKLADFGCSLNLERSGALTPLRSQVGGTYTHRAPELLKGEEVSPRADVYSFGIVLWQLITREPPYEGGDRDHVLYAVVAYDLRPSLTGAAFARSALGRACEALVCRCWSGDPHLRPIAEQLLSELGSIRLDL